MKIELKNIGKVVQANIDINGIAVIAGVNNTGKSTVGKALFAMFNSCFELKDRIDNFKIKSIASEFKRAANETFHPFAIDSDVTYYDVASNIYKKHNEIKEFSNNRLNGDIIKLEEFLETQKDCKDFLHFASYNHKDFIKNINEKITADNNSIAKFIFHKILASEFNDQVSNINNIDEGEICLTIKNSLMQSTIKSNKIVKFSPGLNLQTIINYIDTPYIVDELLESSMANVFQDHKNMLAFNLFYENEKKDIVDDVILEKSLSILDSKINAICKGNFKLIGKNYFYKEDENSIPLNIKNLSTGMKTFSIIKRLIQNGNIRKNGSIILDEPEVHLHPEWQIIFAELLVLLQKTFNLHILLTTHSPYFLRAIQVYAAKHEVADKCKYYLSRLEADGAYIDDVTEDTEKIFASLALPFQILEDEEANI